MRAKTTTILQPHRLEPKFGYSTFSFHMNVGRLTTITRVKEKAIRANTGYRWGHNTPDISALINPLCLFSVPFLLAQRKNQPSSLPFIPQPNDIELSRRAERSGARSAPASG